MNLFEVGDQVIRPDDDIPRKIGTIMSIDYKFGEQWLFVDFEGDRTHVLICKPHDLEKVRDGK